jgi:hypothetical protein
LREQEDLIVSQEQYQNEGDDDVDVEGNSNDIATSSRDTLITLHTPPLSSLGNYADILSPSLSALDNADEIYTGIIG